MSITPPPAPSPSTSAPVLARRPDLDGLRAIAILLVLVHHSFAAVLPGGFIGVDVFFVISGYLISQLLWQQLDPPGLHGKVDSADHVGFGGAALLDFYRRRIQRLFPALLVVLLATGLAGAVWLWPQEYQQLGLHTRWAAGLALNLQLAHEHGYFDTAAQWKPLLHLWSLCIEEQFYLLWPVLLWALHGLGLRQPRSRVWVLGGLCLLTLGAMRWAARQDLDAAFYWPHARAWELVAGAWCAAAVAWRSASPRLQHRAPAVLRWAGLGLILFSAVWLTPARHSSVWLLLPILGTVAVLWAAPSATSSGLSTRPMVWLGQISYPLYLWHWPLIALATVLASGWENVPLAVRLTLLALSVGLAWLTWWGVERHLRHARWRPLAGLLVLAMAAVGAAGYAVEQRQGWPERLSATTRQHAADFDWDVPHWTWSADAAACQGRSQWVQGILTYCKQTEPGPARTALLGDSHALQLYPGLSTRLAQDGAGPLLLRGGSACPPLWDTDIRWRIDTKACHAVMNAALDEVLSSPSVQTVILAYRGPFYTEGVPTAIEQAGLLTPPPPIRLVWQGETASAERVQADNRRLYEHALQHTLTRLHAAGKRVVLVIDTPELGQQPRRCVRQAPWETAPVQPSERPQAPPCQQPHARYLARAQSYLDATRHALQNLPAATQQSLSVWDTLAAFCAEGQCRAWAQGHVLYRDADHLSVPGSQWLAAQWRPQPVQAWLAGASASRP